MLSALATVSQDASAASLAVCPGVRDQQMKPSSMVEEASRFVVGLTGGIGSGKSAAADMFAELGAAVVDADLIAHELTAPGGAAMAAIRNAFGESVVDADGALDRVAMRRLAFSDAVAKSRLEGILHPLIQAESRRRCALDRKSVV